MCQSFTGDGLFFWKNILLKSIIKNHLYDICNETNYTIAQLFYLANGSLVIGQEQDYLGGGFSESEAFLGKLGLLDIWDVVLDEKNITALWNNCEKYHGSVVAWAQMQQYIHGDIKVITSVKLYKVHIRF